MPTFQYADDIIIRGNISRTYLGQVINELYNDPDENKENICPNIPVATPIESDNDSLPDLI